MIFQPGDIAACYGAGLASRVIEWTTASPLAPARLRIGPSHVAILCEYRERMIWVESTTVCRRPCLVQRRVVRGAQAHSPVDRIHDYLGAGGRVDLYCLAPIYRLARDESRLLTRILVDRFVKRGIDYDLRGAVLSGSRALHWTRLFPGADLNQLFCSELVAAVLMRLGRLNLANPTRYNPARLVRELVRHGVCRFEAQLSGDCAPHRAPETNREVNR